MGVGKTVTATGLALAGADAGNYNLTTPSATDLADITAKTLTVSFQAQDKVWDGNTTATIKSSPAPSLVGVVSGDNVILGTGCRVGVVRHRQRGRKQDGHWQRLHHDGTDAGNYVFANPQGTTTASILAWNALGFGSTSP